MLPRKSQKLEFLAVRFNFFELAASFDIKKLVKSQQKLLAASLEIPQLHSMTIASDQRKYMRKGIEQCCCVGGGYFDISPSL